MPSPFPGMDPYLEDRRVWEDFHTTFLVALRAALKPALPPEFFARLDERLYVVEWERQIRPDVALVRPTPPQNSGVAVLERPASSATPPKILRVYEETVREVFLEIRRVREPGEVVTVVELLSPANKERGRGREEYRRKQRDLLASSVSLLEIDLLRSGEHTVAPNFDALTREYGRWDYLISLHRAPAEPGYRDFAVWPLTVRDRLPEVTLPLGPDFFDVPIDLQAVFTRAYDEGPTESLNYSVEPSLPFSEDDVLWANALLRLRGQTSAS